MKRTETESNIIFQRWSDLLGRIVKKNVKGMSVTQAKIYNLMVDMKDRRVSHSEKIDYNKLNNPQKQTKKKIKKHSSSDSSSSYENEKVKDHHSKKNKNGKDSLYEDDSGSSTEDSESSI